MGKGKREEGHPRCDAMCLMRFDGSGEVWDKIKTNKVGQAAE